MDWSEYEMPWDASFWLNVEEQPNGCWEWQGFLNNGYGRLTRRPKKYYAHRYSLMQHGVDVPDDKEVDHLCRNRPCVNPDHLDVVSRTINIRRSRPFMDVSKQGEHNRVKTHCPQGHPYAGDNLYVSPSGGRECRVCRQGHMQRFKERTAA